MEMLLTLLNKIPKFFISYKLKATFISTHHMNLIFNFLRVNFILHSFSERKHSNLSALIGYENY